MAKVAAGTSLKRLVDAWAERLRVRARVVRVQRMNRKWGSCSTLGTVTLATDLAEQEAAFQDFVVVHELLHLRVPSHGRLFKALMTAYLPRWRAMDEARRDGRGLSIGLTTIRGGALRPTTPRAPLSRSARGSWS